MIATTHATFAGVIYLLVLSPLGASLNLLNAAAVAIASLLPDVDTPMSAVGRLCPPLSRRLERAFGHRTLTHSVAGMAAVAILALPLAAFGRECYFCFVAGYATHPFLDTMTVTGVKLFYPFSPVRCVFPLDVNSPRRYRVTTGGKLDKALTLFFALGCIPTWFIAHQGYERFIRARQQSIEAAVRDYNEYSAGHLVTAVVSARDMLSKEHLAGTFPVVGALDARTLLFRTADGALHTLGKAFESEYVAEQVLCLRGDEVRWEAVKLDMSGRSIGEIAGSAGPESEMYLFGSLTLAEEFPLSHDASAFMPVAVRGSSLTLRFAAMRDVAARGIDDCIVERGVLTVRRRRGGAAVPTRGETFARIVVDVAPEESLVVLKRTGDRIARNEPVARRERAAAFRFRRALLEEQRRDLLVKHASELERIEDAAAVAARGLAIDSAAHGADLGLRRAGYLSHGAVERSSLTLEKRRKELQALRRSIERLDAAAALGARRIEASLEELRVRAADAERHAIVRSTADGVLIRTEERTSGGRRMFVLILRTSPPE